MPKIVLLVLVSGLIPLTYAQQKPKELLAAALSVSGEAFFERDGKNGARQNKDDLFQERPRLHEKGKNRHTDRAERSFASCTLHFG